MARMPQVTARQLVRFLKAQRFLEDRRSGTHLTLWHEARKVAVTVPVRTGADLGPRARCAHPKDAGFTVDDYLRRR